MAFDRSLWSDAEDLRRKGEEVGDLVEQIRVKLGHSDMSVAKAAHQFACILEGVCETMLSGPAYRIVEAAARLHAEPSAYPNGDPDLKRMLEGAMEDYATISDEDIAADCADFLNDMAQVGVIGDEAA